MDNSARQANGRPHTVIRMGAGVFSATSTVNGQSATIDLRRAERGDIERVAYWISDLHGLHDKRQHIKARPRKPRLLAPPPPPKSLSPDPLPKPSRLPSAAVM